MKPSVLKFAVLSAAAVLSWGVCAAPKKMVAHRGAGDLTMPEASLPAYSNAVSTACDIVKLDLQYTKDGVIVMGHDQTLKRNMGWDVMIKDHPYAEILERGRFLEKGKPGELRIVRLDEALTAAKPVPEFWLDFKNYSPEMAEKAMAELARAGIDQSRVMIATFSRAALAYFRDKHPSIRRVGHFQFRDGEGHDEGMKRVVQLRDEYRLFGVNMPIAKHQTDIEDIAFLKKSGLWVSLWFVQNKADAAAYAGSGADAFVTDHVSIVRPPCQSRP
ncbi:MAG: hypothetical protein IJI73_10525 [Kiritimatiellae bacterium]|nr:hypothetical protein [Kiritimatiellia bacterium]